MKTLLLLTTLLLPNLTLAAPPDVPQGAWYSSTVSAFIEAGYFPEITAFRSGDNATRAEFIELIVKLQGGVQKAPTGQSFDDVSLNALYYPFFEQAAAAGWMKGASSCYGTHPCLANPESPINRAEAAAILQRAFGIRIQSNAPSFKDNLDGQWFTDSIRIAAGNCILQGDSGSGKVRPADRMNRAEMVVMLDRLKRGLIYPDCTAVGEAYKLPKAPGLVAPSVSSIGQAQQACTVSAWDCENFGTCTPITGDKAQGVQYQLCKIVDQDCTNPEDVKPIKEKGCIQELETALEVMKKRVAHGDALVTEMESEAWKLLSQFANEVFGLQFQYKTELAEYKSLYESSVSLSELAMSISKKKRTGSSRMVFDLPLVSRHSDIELMEQRMNALEKQFYNVDRVYCRGDGCSQ